MADKKKTFNDLLSEAPLAANEDTVTLVGALSRSSQPGKFVLTTSPGNSVTLDVDAVKSHQVIGGGVGQLLVQVDVDRAKVPESATEAVLKSGGGIAQSGLPDVKHPALEKHPWEEPVRRYPEAMQAANFVGSVETGKYDMSHPSTDKLPWEESVRTHPETDLGPFALATEQQAPASALSAMQSPFGIHVTGWRDMTHTWMDKNPIADATGRPPYLD